MPSVPMTELSIQCPYRHSSSGIWRTAPYGMKDSMLKLFERAGFPLYQLYGMTEAGWIAWNSPRANKVRTVGLASFPGSVHIADDGEILVSRPWNHCSCYEGSEGEASEGEVFPAEDTVATEATASCVAAAIWTRDDDLQTRRLAVQAMERLNKGALQRTPILAIVFPQASLSIENGLLTRNLKVDRTAVRSRFQKDLRSINDVARAPLPGDGWQGR